MNQINKAGFILATDTRIWFLQLLRALAILLVVFSHTGLNFWCANNLYSTGLHVNPLKDFIPPFYISQLCQLENSLHCDIGIIGAAIFFIVSGFVIPISIKKYGSFFFLIARYFRIFPTYAIALALIALISAIYCWVTHAQFPYSAHEFVWSFSLINMNLPHGFIDPVIWTLQIEVEFYLLAAVIATVSSLEKFSAILVTAILLWIASDMVINPHNFLSPLIGLLIGSSSSLIFILIGTAFYNYYERIWSLKQFIIGATVLYLLFIAAVQSIGPKAVVEISYSVGLLIFLLVFSFREAFVKNWYMNWIGEISYPLYLIHNIFGGILITLLFAIMPNMYLSGIIAMCLILFVSTVVHYAIEQPGTNFGKSFIKLPNRKLGKQYESGLTGKTEAVASTVLLPR